jgi:hypothetical protein
MPHPPTAGSCRSIDHTQLVPLSLCSAREIHLYLPAYSYPGFEPVLEPTGDRRANQYAKAAELMVNVIYVNHYAAGLLSLCLFLLPTADYFPTSNMYNRGTGETE